ncbi:MAG TPA: hypothetical protein ENG95_03370 [Nitrospirae bacterium]|nr:hypothetical protein BMS3Abin10_01841 [bacterium BMS3Abin10]GBE39941.1 hypothetical protein BMS3Bbin08_02575 [bacterium BMS3Bbin08]HDH51781.1 hypothetical protein [Nitrospirota bacterium]HDK81974.1 hypothetical protein [Nitrospirota bacterium]HDO25672.1 hypothetical protein [Nitrospirota bacterium]
MRSAAVLLLLCVIPCFFIIPVLCGPVELSIGEENNFCWIMSFINTSDALILAPSITYLGIAEGVAFLKDTQEPFNIPLVFSKKDRPPEVKYLPV